MKQNKPRSFSVPVKHRPDEDPYRDWQLVMQAETCRTDGAPRMRALTSLAGVWLDDSSFATPTLNSPS